MSKKTIVLTLLILLAALIFQFIVGVYWPLSQSDDPPPEQPPSLGIIVPHHDWAKEYREEFWRALFDKSLRSDITLTDIRRVVVIGPDHFNPNQQQITYASDDFALADGTFRNFFARPDTFTADYVENDTLVKNDHAITSLVRELRDNFPRADIAAFLIGQQATYADLAPLSTYLEEECRGYCAVVASVDFSHFVTRDVAEVKDAETIQQLQNGQLCDNFSTINQTAVHADSPQALCLVNEFGHRRGALWWQQNRTFSGVDDTTTDTTSHIYGAYLPPIFVQTTVQ